MRETRHVWRSLHETEHKAPPDLRGLMRSFNHEAASAADLDGRTPCKPYARDRIHPGKLADAGTHSCDVGEDRLFSRTKRSWTNHDALESPRTRHYFANLASEGTAHEGRHRRALRVRELRHCKQYPSRVWRKRSPLLLSMLGRGPPQRQAQRSVPSLIAASSAESFAGELFVVCPLV